MGGGWIRGNMKSICQFRPKFLLQEELYRTWNFQLNWPYSGKWQIFGRILFAPQIFCLLQLCVTPPGNKISLLSDSLVVGPSLPRPNFAITVTAFFTYAGKNGTIILAVSASSITSSGSSSPPPELSQSEPLRHANSSSIF